MTSFRIPLLLWTSTRLHRGRHSPVLLLLLMVDVNNPLQLKAQAA